MEEILEHHVVAFAILYPQDQEEKKDAEKAVGGIGISSSHSLLSSK